MSVLLAIIITVIVCAALVAVFHEKITTKINDLEVSLHAKADAIKAKAEADVAQLRAEIAAKTAPKA